MVIIGVDPHPDGHTAVAVDRNGKLLADISVSNSERGLAKLRRWAETFEPSRWAIEGANNPFIVALSYPLAEQGLVVDISPSATSQYRSKRGKKNDVIDAQNVARVLLANPELPLFRPQAALEQLKELSRTRERLANELKANRMARRKLDKESVAYNALSKVVDCLQAEVKRLEKPLRALVKRLMPSLLNLCGVGVIHAATLLAEAGDPSRFANKHAFASYCGCAPVERASGRNRRMQLNTGGNRRLNRTCHMIALVRLKCEARTKAFINRKEQEGKTIRAALRALKTHISRELYTFMRNVNPFPPAPCDQTP